jgi:hypothetical protein
MIKTIHFADHIPNVVPKVFAFALQNQNGILGGIIRSVSAGLTRLPYGSVRRYSRPVDLWYSTEIDLPNVN